MFDRTQGRGPRTAIVTGNLNHVGIGFGNPSGDRPDANGRDQLHRHFCLGIDLMEVENQLCQILDRINIVVRRRRN